MLFEQYRWMIGDALESPFMNKHNVYQDGTTPMWRDADGILWAMSGHSHAGDIAMFRGTCLEDMTLAWRVQTLFSVGSAPQAYNGVRYPEGVLPRGSIWPFGLYICPNTHRFFCWFHNETGWNGQGTAYDAFGPCETPRFDSDFRHVGLMHSDDEGRTWQFDRWVLTGYEPCFTERYIPEGDNVIGQSGDIVRFGSGDFCLFAEPNGEYIYLLYDIITMDLSKTAIGEVWQSCDAHIARTRRRTDGTMGDFVKYYDGAFSEAGNLGKESVILHDAWHPRVVYSEPIGCYIMTSKPIIKVLHGEIPDLDEGGRVMQVCTSTDLIHWSEPEVVYKDGKPWGNHYNAMVSDSREGQPHILTGNTFSILNNHNGTDVMRYPVTIQRR